jgi:hypothetical protein
MIYPESVLAGKHEAEQSNESDIRQLFDKWQETIDHDENEGYDPENIEHMRELEEELSTLGPTTLDGMLLSLDVVEHLMDENLRLDAHWARCVRALINECRSGVDVMLGHTYPKDDHAELLYDYGWRMSAEERLAFASG